MTTTSTTPDLDTTVIENLDFELPCEITGGLDAAPICDQAAEWIVVAKAHCSKRVAHRLICDEHQKYIVGGGLGYCTACKVISPMRDLVVRIERLKP